MDSVTIDLITNALTSGAKFVASSNALPSVAKFVALSVAREEIVVKYRSLKEFIRKKLGVITPVDELERKPTEGRQKLLAEDLGDAIEALPTSQEIENVINELLERTKALNESLEKIPQAECDAVGLDFENVKKVNAKVKNIISEGGAKFVGVKVKHSESADITAEDIQTKK